MQFIRIKKIIRENKPLLETLKRYDETRELPFQRKRIDLTLSVRTISNLKKLSEKARQPISRIIDEKFR
jgi:hypothetical protein